MYDLTWFYIFKTFRIQISFIKDNRNYGFPRWIERMRMDGRDLSKLCRGRFCFCGNRSWDSKTFPSFYSHRISKFLYYIRLYGNEHIMYNIYHMSHTAVIVQQYIRHWKYVINIIICILIWLERLVLLRIILPNSIFGFMRSSCTYEHFY